MQTPTIVKELATLVTRLPSLDANWRRIRLAVTYEEYEIIRQYCTDKDGYFAQRIRGIPLVIEATPTDPPLILEHR